MTLSSVIAPLIVGSIAFAQTTLQSAPHQQFTPSQLVSLIRASVTALNHANDTGNYSVLRDLGTATFRLKNKPAHLALAFRTLRERNIDLSPVLTSEPRFTTRPVILTNGALRLKGFFPTQPSQVTFDLAYRKVGTKWRLSAMAVDVKRLQASASAVQPGQASAGVTVREQVTVVQNAGQTVPVVRPPAQKPQPDSARVAAEPSAATPGTGTVQSKPQIDDAQSLWETIYSAD